MSKNIGLIGHSERDGDEPIILASGIHETWGRAWPNVIARVWFEEHSGSFKNSSWYEDIFSGDSKRVHKALEAEGFVIDIGIDPESDNLTDIDKWLNLNIIIKRRDDGIYLGSNNEKKELLPYKEVPEDNKYNYDYKEYSKKNGWGKVERLEHTLILTIPPKPDKPEEFAVAISDYQSSGKIYPFTCCVC